MRDAKLSWWGLVALLAGCSSVQAVGAGMSLGEPGAAEHDPDCTWYLYSDVWGFTTLFNVIPLVAGDAERPGELAWFRHTETLRGAVRLLEEAAGALGADELREVRADVISDWTWFIFWLPEARASALVVCSPAVRAIPPLEAAPPAPGR